MNTILKTALGYLSKNLSVIPVGKNKRPLIPWKEYQTRYATKEEVTKWFEDGTANIGIVTGKISNLTVIDIEEGGEWEQYPETLTVKTGGKGIHLYYAYQEGVSNKARIKELTDIRNDGGFVVAPPSSTDKGLYLYIKVVPISIFPKEHFKIKEKINIAEYKGVKDGGRNDAMVRYVGHLLPTIHPSDWETIGKQKIKEANKKNIPPLNDKELFNIYNYIVKKEKKNPSFRKKLDNAKIIKPEDEEIMLMSEVAQKQPISYLKTFSTGFKKFDEAMEGGFKEGDLIVITGQSGHGKTSMSQTFTCNLTSKGIPVLFFSYEVLVTRIWKKFEEMGMSKSSVIYSPFKTVTGSIDWIEKQILKSVEKYNTKNIVIDHLGFLMPRQTELTKQLSQNYSVFLTNICRDLKTIAINNKLIIQLISHVRKIENGKKVSLNDLKDSAGIVQESDHVFAIHRLLDKSFDGEEVYLKDSEIYMLKNRVTGKTPKIICQMINNKFTEKYNIEEI